MKTRSDVERLFFSLAVSGSIDDVLTSPASPSLPDEKTVRSRVYERVVKQSQNREKGGQSS